MVAASTFPFGQPATARPPRAPSTLPAGLVVLGVYPSALHVRWTPPAWACGELGVSRVGALAVDDEPTVFWDGVDAAARVDGWCKAVGFRTGDERLDWGHVEAAGNGTSGRSVVARVLEPLGVAPAATWFTEAIDHFLVKSGGAQRQQGDVIATCYAPFATAVGLPAASLPPRPPPSKLIDCALADHAYRLRAEIAQADSPMVVTLGEEARRVLHGLAENAAGPPTLPLDRRRFEGQAAATYGEAGTFALGGRELAWHALVHPGQRSKQWADVHDAWIKRRRAG